MPSQGQGSRKLRVFGFQLHSWCSGTPRFWALQLHKVKCPKVPAASPLPHTHGQRQQCLVIHRQDFCTLTGLIQPSTLSTTISSSCQCEMPAHLAWLQVTGHYVKQWEDFALVMEVAKNSEIQVWGKPWLLYNPPTEKHLRTPAELPFPKIFPLKYLYSEVNFQTSMQYFPASIIKANYIYIFHKLWNMIYFIS